MDDRQLYYDRMVTGANWDDRTNRHETLRRLNLIFDQLLSDVPLHGVSLLDAGSGGGHFSAAACDRGAKVTSLDVGQHLLDQVASRCNSTRVLGSVLEIPFDDGWFDVVLSTEVIEHTPDPEGALAELARVVRPGGCLLVTAPNKLWQPIVRAATTLRLRHYSGYENFLWARHARNVVASHGLVVERFVGFNVLPVFQKPFEPFLAATDRLLGSALPSAFVNYAVRARRPAV
jgi:2-polyprenyl-3-methyl-5-hydroxy-6-metoxy-1,4-benzoquinol methylase